MLSFLVWQAKVDAQKARDEAEEFRKEAEALKKKAGKASAAILGKCINCMIIIVYIYHHERILNVLM